MKYVPMGRSGLKVSQLALGCGFRGLTDQGEMETLIHHAIDHGINFIDCANSYGGGVAEEVLGRVLARGRNDLVITTKVTSSTGPGPNDIGGSRYHIMRQIDRSLMSLHTDHVDIYIVHWRDHTTPMEETVHAMTDVVRSGKARYWGVSNYRAWEACRALWIAEAAAAPGFITMQNPYNLLDRELEGEIMPFCGEMGSGMMTFSPLAIGVLSGDIAPTQLRGRQLDPATNTWKEKIPDERARRQATRVIEVVREIAIAKERHPTAVAIQWVLSHQEVTAAIAGPDTTAQLDTYLDGVDCELTIDERERLDAISAPDD